MTWEDARTYANNAAIVTTCATGTCVACFGILGVGTWVYNKITGSHVTMGEAGAAVFNLGALLAEWASIVKGGSKI